MNKDEDCICFYRDAVIAGHDDLRRKRCVASTSLVDYTLRLQNEAIARCDEVIE